MNHFKLKAAVKKYSEQFKTDPEAVREAVGLDYEPDEVPTILAALATPEDPILSNGNGQPPILDVYDTKPSHYKWYDEFDARIQKKEVRNPLAQKIESVITGWELQKKKHPKFIEPHIAIQLNSFADGYDVIGIGNLLLPKGEYKTGDVVAYRHWATEQGKNFAEDINILLTSNPAA